MIKYSIIVPCFNSENFIKVCLDVLTKQTIDKGLFEVIFVDDCSKDNTVQILERYKKQVDFKVQILQNKVNSGPGVSRHNAAMAAVGEYLCFCDSDDWYSEDFLLDINTELEESCSDMLVFDMSYVLGEKIIRKNYTAPFCYGDKFSYLSNCAESLCNLVVKRSLFLSIPLLDVRNGEDLALVPLLIAKSDKISHIDKSYYNYVMRSDSASLGKIAPRAFNNMLLAFRHICQNLDSSNIDIQKCIEYLGIKTVLYNATLMAIKGGNNNNVLAQIVDDFSVSYPEWSKNSYKNRLGLAKNVYLWAVKSRLWIICRLFATLHSYLLKHSYD